MAQDEKLLGAKYIRKYLKEFLNSGQEGNHKQPWKGPLLNGMQELPSVASRISFG
jgi:hypothetical protein